MKNKEYWEEWIFGYKIGVIVSTIGISSIYLILILLDILNWFIITMVIIFIIPIYTLFNLIINNIKKHKEVKVNAK